MNTTPVSIDIRSIDSTKDLVQLIDEVRQTKTPRALAKDNEILAVLMPVEDVFGELSENAAFLAEADAARRELADDTGTFTNLTEKYRHLIKP
jgi:hypothetical protein